MVVHVGAKRVDGLNDGLVHDLRVGVSSLPEDITLGHHGGDVDSSSEWVNRNVLLLPIGTDTLSNLPGVGSINLAHGVAAVKGLDDTMDSTEKNATLSINIRLVLGAKGGLEHERRAEGNAPAEGQVCGLTGLVLVDTEGSVDSGAVDLLALLVKATDGGSHTLGADSDDIHILREGLAD